MMRPEIEYKFDVPVDADASNLLDRVQQIFESRGWSLHGQKTQELHFQYYDTAGMDAYACGETIRRVGEFESPKRFRYDYKVGPIDDRLEGETWSDERYAAGQIAAELGVVYAGLVESASADTMHLKLYFQNGQTSVEVTHDIFDVDGGRMFKELEIELEEGSAQDLESIARSVQAGLELKELHTQKYSRVVDSVRDYLTG